MFDALAVQQSSAGGAVSALVGLAIAAFYVAAFWLLFTKSGQPGWAIFIPIYNTIVFLRIVGRPAWWLVLFFIPLANVVVGFIVTLDLARVFGKGAGFALGLFFLGFIFVPILAFGGAQYTSPSRRSALTPAAAF